MEHLHAVILAGGSGTRLWPLSTPQFPKQFLPLPGGKSMIQETLARVESLITPERSWVVTGRNMAELAHEHLPTVPLSHILGEPVGVIPRPLSAGYQQLLHKRTRKRSSLHFMPMLLSQRRRRYGNPCASPISWPSRAILSPWALNPPRRRQAMAISVSPIE